MEGGETYSLLQKCSLALSKNGQFLQFKVPKGTLPRFLKELREIPREKETFF
jgi:hypothetical protein